MGQDTHIEWAHHSFNPWIGCAKVSAGCANCYAEADFDKRKGIARWGHGQPRHRTSNATWKLPLRWNRKAAIGDRPRIFCASLADVFDSEVPIEWLADLLRLISQTDRLTWMLLTKRPHLIIERLAEALDWMFDHAEVGEGWGTTVNDMMSWVYGNNPPPHVWIGTSVEDQAAANERIPHLLQVSAAVRFLSCEPLLSSLDLRRWMWNSGYPNQDEVYRCRGCGSVGTGDYFSLPTGGDDFECACMECGHSAEDPDVDQVGNINWVIAGGESGPNARPMHQEWARSLRDQCQGAGVPFFFKQWGEWLPINHCPGQPYHNWFPHGHPGTPWTGTDQGGFHATRVGKKRAGRLLDGRTWDEVPS